MYIYVLICEVSLSSQFKIIKKKKKGKSNDSNNQESYGVRFREREDKYK